MKRMKFAVLAYRWATPPAKAKTRYKPWSTAFLEQVFARPNGWSVAEYWKRATLGLVEPEFVIFPWRTLGPARAGLETDRGGSVEFVRQQAIADSQALAGFDKIIAFVHPPPSNAGATGSPGDALLDEDADLSFYQHEVGHMIGFQHAWGPKDGGGFQAYADSYCVMGFTNDSSRTISAPKGFASATLHQGMWRSERRLSAASLYRHLPEFAASSRVVRVSASRTTSVTLGGLASPDAGLPVLVVASTPHGEITAEYRSKAGDDANVRRAVVIHSIRRRSVPPDADETDPIFYEGKAGFDKGDGRVGAFRTEAGDLAVSVGLWNAHRVELTIGPA